MHDTEKGQLVGLAFTARFGHGLQVRAVRDGIEIGVQRSARGRRIVTYPYLVDTPEDAAALIACLTDLAAQRWPDHGLVTE